MPPTVRKLTREEVTKGLDSLSRKVKALPNITFPVHFASSGGAIALFVFGTRDSTNDVDIYHPDWTQILEKPFVDLAREVAEEMGWRKAGYWFNGALVNIVESESEYAGVFDEAIQGPTIYQSETIVIHIMPFKFQLHCKLARISRKYRAFTAWAESTKDLDDSLTLLHALVQKEGRPLKASEIKAWYNGVGRVEIATINHVAAEYHSRKGIEGIVQDIPS